MLLWAFALARIDIGDLEMESHVGQGSAKFIISLVAFAVALIIGGFAAILIDLKSYTDARAAWDNADPNTRAPKPPAFDWTLCRFRFAVGFISGLVGGGAITAVVAAIPISGGQ